jgi:hypothetical protein
MLMMLYLWTRLRVSFNEYISILVSIQVIYRVLTRRLTTDDTLLSLNNQSGLVSAIVRYFPGLVVTRSQVQATWWHE